MSLDDEVDQAWRAYRDEQTRAWRRRNPEQVKAAKRAWYARNLETRRASQRLTYRATAIAAREGLNRRVVLEELRSGERVWAPSRRKSPT